MPKPSGVGLAEKIAKKACEQMGYTLVDVELVKESTGRFLRFYIDKPDGVSLSDCESLHRLVQKQIEHIDYDYMEVSSPGVDRPLKHQKDFDAVEGQMVEVRLYRPINGTKVFKGTLIGLVDGVITIACATGEEMSFAQKTVGLVKIAFDFDEGMLDVLDEEDKTDERDD